MDLGSKPRLAKFTLTNSQLALNPWWNLAHRHHLHLLNYILSRIFQFDASINLKSKEIPDTINENTLWKHFGNQNPKAVDLNDIPWFTALTLCEGPETKIYVVEI